MSTSSPAARAVAPEPAPVDTGAPAAERRAVPHYPFLDGIRGLGALTVLIVHLLQPFGLESELPATWTIPPLLRQFVVSLYAGRYAVIVFIVLSGYCLMLPVVRTPGLRLRGGLWDYALRRSRRILPTYLFALLLSVAFYRLVWNAPVDARSVLAHVFLVHNLSPAWNFDLNPVMWTVAIEWQIYAFFPLLLLPTWRRWGWKAAVLVALGVGIAPVLLLPAGQDLMWTAPWFLALFAFGMVAAAADPYRWPWGRISLGAMALGLAVGVTGGIGRIVVDDLLVGAGTACLILACARGTEEARSPAQAPRPLLLRVLESRPAVWVGTMSYSVYLTHILIKWALLDQIRAMTPSIPLGLATLLGGGGVLSLGAGYLVHRWVERPFMAPARRSSRAEGAGLREVRS